MRTPAKETVKPETQIVCVFLEKCQVPLKQQSADLLGKQNSYPTSIVSAPDTCLHCSHRANARIRARTRKHKQTWFKPAHGVGKQASEKHKVKKTNKKEEQHAHIQKQNYMSDVGKARCLVRIWKLQSAANTIALSRKLKKQPNTPKSCSKYHAKASLQTTQETKSPRTMSEAQNNQIWVAGPPIMHAKSIPNSPPKHTKTTQNRNIISYAKEH